PGNYLLAQDVDLSGIANWTPIGDLTTNYSGTFNGLGNVVTNLTVNSGGVAGLFGQLNGTVKNIGVIGGSVTGVVAAGGLVGFIDSSGVVSNSYSTVSVTDANNNASIGGLVGTNS